MESIEPPSKRLRKTPFQQKHLLQYGLCIASRDARTSEVVAVRCRFCVCFEREELVKKSSTSWTFEGPPFKTDNYMQHLCINHQVRWRKYQKLSTEDKYKYFAVSIKHAETICHFMENQSAMSTFIIRCSIVDVIIGDMLWNENDLYGQSQANAMSLFKLNDDGNYCIQISQKKQFELVIRFVARGMSFSMAADAVQDAKEFCDIPKLGFCSESLVASYVRTACAISIENIAQILHSAWTFSVAFDASCDLQGVSWIDVRIRFYQNSSIENLHLITLPFSGRHTGLAMFEMFCKLFDAVCPLWKDKLIGCSTDDATNMTGHLSGVVTSIQEVVRPNFIRVWCLLHQIDIVMQKTYIKMLAVDFRRL